MRVNGRITGSRRAMTFYQQGICLYKTTLNEDKLWKQIQRKLLLYDGVCTRLSSKFCGDKAKSRKLFEL